MKKLPELNLSYEPLMRILYGAIPTKLLLTAVELKVFSHLTTPESAEVVAHKIGSPGQNTRLFLDALVANELLRKRDGRYINTPIAETFLVEGQPTYLGEVLTILAEWTRPALESMTALVRGEACRPAGPTDPSLRERETEIYANEQRAGRAQQAAALVSKLPEFAGMTKMLDLGGGAGVIALAIVGAHPTMTGVIFDRPGVVEVARRFIREYDLENRVDVMGGDYTTDSIGEGYDLIWTSFTLNFCRDNLDQIIGKIYTALNPGGVYISLAEGLTHERTRPKMMVNAMLAVSLGGKDLVFDEGEIANAMLRVGFKSVHSRVPEGPQPHGPVIVDIARK